MDLKKFLPWNKWVIVAVVCVIVIGTGVIVGLLVRNYNLDKSASELVSDNRCNCDEDVSEQSAECSDDSSQNDETDDGAEQESTDLEVSAAPYSMEMEENRLQVYETLPDGTKTLIAEKALLEQMGDSFWDYIRQDEVLLIDNKLVFLLRIGIWGCEGEGTAQEEEACVELLGAFYQLYQESGGIWSYDFRTKAFTHLVEVPEFLDGSKTAPEFGGIRQVNGLPAIHYRIGYMDLNESGLTYGYDYVLELETGKTLLVETDSWE